MTDKLLPEPKKGVLDIARYIPGKDKVEGVAKVYKLSSNETPLGASPKVADAISKVLEAAEVYPDGSAQELRQAIAKTHGLNVDNLLCGNGSDELLTLLCQTYLAPGDEAIYSEHGFLVYKIQISAAGATPIVAPETDYTVNVDAILERVTDKTKMVFVANPNNPTGTYVPMEDIRRLHENLPSNVILVLDAAYAEYVRKNDYESGVELVSANENVVMTRTFSKIYGLAAFRVGWIYAPLAVIDAMDRIRGPFNVNAVAIAAGAAAIQDKAHTEKAIAHNQIWLDRLTGELQNLGLKITPSVGNFLLIHFPDQATHNADSANDYLLSKGFVLRKVAGYGLPGALRMTIGTEDANLGVLSALKEFMASS